MENFQIWDDFVRTPLWTDLVGFCWISLLLFCVTSFLDVSFGLSTIFFCGFYDFYAFFDIIFQYFSTFHNFLSILKQFVVSKFFISSYSNNFNWNRTYLNCHSRRAQLWHHSPRTSALPRSSHPHRVNAAVHLDMLIVQAAYDHYPVYQSGHAHFVSCTEVVFYLKFWSLLVVALVLVLFNTHLKEVVVVVVSGKYYIL